MPYKTGKFKGELTTPELRKLVKAHNILTSIKIPKGASRDDIIKIIEKKGYKVDHEKKKLTPKKEMKKQPVVKLLKAKAMTKPKPKTELQKQNMMEAKKEKEEKKKKEERVIRKKAVEEEKKRAMDRKKQPKEKTTIKSKKPMKKEDEVRPKEKVGRPKFDPKKIKVFEPKPKVEKPKEEKPKKETGKSRLEAKKKMMTVFKDIITGFKEILEENPDTSKLEIKSMKVILDKLNKGSMSFSKIQKGLIKRAIDAYLDMDFVDDPELEKEVKIARELKKKYE